MLSFLLLTACNHETTPAPSSAPAEALHKAPLENTPAIDPRAAALFKPLSARMDGENPAPSAERIALGRMLYYETRLSKNHDISCNSCHQLDRYGVDGEPTSPGHKGVRGGRNSPTSYNAALHIAQFWDGREPDVEAQAKGPILNPVEMAMPDPDTVVATLESIPGYVSAFQAAFPGEDAPITYDNMAKAIGAFERGLVTPSPFDAYLSGDVTALSSAQVEGMTLFLDIGCTTCHVGEGLGGSMYQKIGLMKPYQTDDVGRAEVTGSEADAYVFKVPSLRNITETAPYFHDGSIATIEEAVRVMADVQLGKTLTDAQVDQLVVFLDALTGTPDAQYIKPPALPPSGPSTPAPDPS